MAKTFRRRDLDDDEDETLQDGKAVRLPMMMRDSRPPHWQDAADKYFENRAANSRVTGITGMPKSLHQPGFRFSDANANKAALDAAYRAEAEYLENAWKGADKEGYAPTSEGMTCTVQGSAYPNDYGAPGHIRRGADGSLVCVPDRKSSAGDRAMTMDQIYEEYDAALRVAYKSSR